MGYSKLDNGFHLHPKVVGLSDGAYRLHIGGICYAGTGETNGEIKASALPFILPRSAKTLAGYVAELVSAGIWEAGEGVFGIHDYLKYQRSKEQITAIRDATKTRVKRLRNGVTSSVVTQVLHDTETTTETETEARSLKLLSARLRYAAVVGTPAHNATLRQQLDDIDAAHPPECVEAAFNASASAKAPWPYAKAILDSCLQQGHGPRRSGGTNNARANQGNRSVRQGDGRGVGASQRVAGAGVDWDAEQREHERTLARAKGGTEGAA